MLARESELRHLPFAEIQQRATAGYLRGATYFEVNEAAVGGVSADCRFIDTQRLASDVCEGTVEQVFTSVLPVAFMYSNLFFCLQRSGARLALPQNRAE